MINSPKGDIRDRSDEELMVLFAQTHDPKPFNEMHRRYNEKVKNFLLRKTRGNKFDVDDILQETWAKVDSRRNTYKSLEDQFVRWLFRIALNCFRDHYRRNKREQERRENLEPEQRVDKGMFAGLRSALPEVGVYLKQIIQTVYECLEKLPPEQQEVLRLRGIIDDMNNMTYADIAERLGVGVETVKSRIRYAKPKVKACLIENGISLDLLVETW